MVKTSPLQSCKLIISANNSKVTRRLRHDLSLIFHNFPRLRTSSRPRQHQARSPTIHLPFRHSSPARSSVL